LIQEVAENGQFLFVATTLLNLLEVAPRPSHLDLICAAVKTWMAAHPDSRDFWIEHSVGRRTCAVISTILALDPKAFAPEQKIRQEIDDFLGKLVRLGVAEAHRLEEDLRQIK
jgi:hypothetical protein